MSAVDFSVFSFAWFFPKPPRVDDCRAQIRGEENQMCKTERKGGRGNRMNAEDKIPPLNLQKKEKL